MRPRPPGAACANLRLSRGGAATRSQNDATFQGRHWLEQGFPFLVLGDPPENSLVKLNHCRGQVCKWVSSELQNINRDHLVDLVDSHLELMSPCSPHNFLTSYYYQHPHCTEDMEAQRDWSLAQGPRDSE